MALTGIGSNYDQLELLRLQAQQSGSTTGNQNVSNPISFGAEEGTETTDIEDILAGYTEAESAIAGTSASTSTSATGATSQEIQEEIEELEKEKEENIEKMEKIEDEIEDLADAAEKNIMNAAKEQESAVKEHEEETEAAVQENIAAYVEANKEGGEGMTREELQQNIKGSLPDVPDVAEAVSALVEANEQINEIDSLLGDLNSLIQDTQSIEQEIEAKQGEYEAAVEAETAAASSSSGCCDPIGFTATDADGNAAQYDFIVDDGNFDSTNDFLGASGQWSEMQALDTDGDNVVSAAELQAGNIKAVKTNADGSQEIVDLANEFGDDFSIDLNSYQEGGSHSAVDTTGDSDGDGIANQTMLGTFNVNANGQTVQGYNTLDDTDWLADNYGLTADASSAVDTDTDSFEYSEDLQPHVNFFNTYTQKVEDLRSSLEDAWESLGLSKETMDHLNEAAVNEANEKAENFFSSLEADNEEGEELSADGITNQTVTENTTDNADLASITPEELELLREEGLIAA